MLILFLLAQSLSCPNFSSESELISYTHSNPSSLESCAEQALSKNWLDCLNTLITSSIFSSHTFSDSFKTSVKDKRKYIESLIAKASQWGKITTLSPAFQWSQSPNTTFLDIKYSNRLEAPGCVSLSDLQIEITETHFYFSGHCLKSNQKVRFLLDFDTWGLVDKEASSFSEGGNGRMTVSLVKSKEEAWELPLKGKKPQNLHIWWEMKEKFKKEMNKLTGEVDEEEKKDDQFDDLLNNPNVVIENSYVNGKYVDNRKERGYNK